MHTLSPTVEALLRTVSAEIVMPRYQRLASHEVEIKSPGEEVTIADREAELRLNEGLDLILPEARMIGEEACAADPSLLDGLEHGTAWVIDPIDGTSNFAAGKPHFGIMVALVRDGVAEAGWLFDPILNRMCHAAQGLGAFVDGKRIYAQESASELPIAAISLKFLNPEQRLKMVEQTAGKVTPVDPPMCAAEQYPRVAFGTNDIAVFARVLPWDHIPGALFLTEAGGKVARMDGSPYQFWDGRTGMLAASSPAMWDRAAQLFGEGDFE
jgi:fructose-1,6-bisphosphatase/inositol monophosphatase family enzyme